MFLFRKRSDYYDEDRYDSTEEDEVLPANDTTMLGAAKRRHIILSHFT